MPGRREEWLRLRKSGIGGSDAGAVCGMNPFSSPAKVFQDKTSDEISELDSEAVRQGNDLEDYVARRFMKATGLKGMRLGIGLPAVITGSASGKGRPTKGVQNAYLHGFYRGIQEVLEKQGSALMTVVPKEVYGPDRAGDYGAADIFGNNSA